MCSGHISGETPLNKRNRSFKAGGTYVHSPLYAGLSMRGAVHFPLYSGFDFIGLDHGPHPETSSHWGKKVSAIPTRKMLLYLP
jgi:hypothetical protein